MARNAQHVSIAHLLSILAGEKELVAEEKVDGRDAHAGLMEALFLLAREDVAHVVELLQRELQNGRTERAFSLAWTIAHRDDPTALPVLLAAVRHRDQHVRWAACIGLRRLDTPQALDALNAAAADRAADVRSEAVEALHDQGDASSLPVLRKRLQDRYPGIRQMAQVRATMFGWLQSSAPIRPATGDRRKSGRP